MDDISFIAKHIAEGADRITSSSFASRSMANLIKWVSLPIWFVVWLWRNKSLRNIIIWAIILCLLIIEFFGIAILLTGLSFIARFGFAAVFMIAQFAFLFMFLSSTKNIETIPGDVGLVNFEDDYFGNEQLVKTVRQWVHLLTAGQGALEEMGAEAISGILLEGPPGTGKTLLARCLATASGAAFIGMTGSDFQAMFIGVGPMKVMRTYGKARAKAKEHGACIVFIDEIDAIGGNRGSVSGDPRTGPVAGGMSGGMFGGGGLGVMSKLLTELDGVREMPLRDQIQNRMRRVVGLPEIRQGLVLTMAATNRFASLDPALIRPGRIDKTIHVDPPDKTSRRLIIEGYLRKVKHDGSIDVERLVLDTYGVTPALLASAIQRGAPRHAIFDEREELSHADITKALQEDEVGLANPITDFDPEQRHQVAVHEAGHAVMAWLVRKDKRITNLSIVRRGGGILGYMRDVEQTEVFALPLRRLSANIMVALAGHVATIVVLGEPWTGAASDLAKVRSMMYALADHGELGGIPFVAEDPFASEHIRKEADEYLAKTEIKVCESLEANRDKLDALTEALLEKDELDSKEIYEILEGEDE